MKSANSDKTLLFDKRVLFVIDTGSRLLFEHRLFNSYLTISCIIHVSYYLWH